MHREVVSSVLQMVASPLESNVVVDILGTSKHERTEVSKQSDIIILTSQGEWPYVFFAQLSDRTLLRLRLILSLPLPLSLLSLGLSLF